MKRVLALLIFALLLAGCAGPSGQESPDYVPAEEERLVLYTSHKEAVYAPIVKEFEERTGIWVKVEAGGTTELLERIAAGDTDCDLMFGGGVDSLSAYADCFEPYVSPCMENVAQRFQGSDIYTPFSSLPVVLIYNPRLLYANAPVGWESLLDEAWRGKIAFADPMVSGSSYTALCTMIQALDGEPEALIDAFIENLNGNILSSSDLVIGAVAEGNCYIGVTLEETALKAIKAGYDIAMVYPQEGTSDLPDGAAVIKDCAHAENARLFIDFLLSSDMQNCLGSAFCRRSVRDGAALPENCGELTLLDYDIAWASQSQTEILSRWAADVGEAQP